MWKTNVKGIINVFVISKKASMSIDNVSNICTDLFTGDFDALHAV